MLDWRPRKGVIALARKVLKPEQIINKLREAEVAISQGNTIAEASRRIEVTEQTYYRWRRQYGGMGVEQARRLRELEKENTRLKRLVADLSLDNAILKEAARGNS
jgi:putative transposase